METFKDPVTGQELIDLSTVKSMTFTVEYPATLYLTVSESLRVPASVMFSSYVRADYGSRRWRHKGLKRAPLFNSRGRGAKYRGYDGKPLFEGSI